MNLRSDPPTSAALDAAQELIRATAAAVLVEAASNLLVLMRSAPTYRERGQFAFAQIHLLQSQDMFLAAFGGALREKVAEEIGPKSAERALGGQTDWQAVGLVGEDQVAERLAFERIGQFISHECDAELRELAGYMSALLRHGWTDPDRNPLRGYVIGSAAHKAIEKISADAETQKIFVKEIGQLLAKALPVCYRTIIADLKARAVRPAELAVRPPETSSAAGPSASAAYDEVHKIWEQSLKGRFRADAGDSLQSWERSIRNRFPQADAPQEEYDPESSAALLDRLIRGGLPGPFASGSFPARSLASIQADAGLMSLLRRLNDADSVRGGLQGLSVARPAERPVGAGLGELMAANLIRAHREELVHASQGKLDHMVIEVVSSLFDQILSDSRVPPQMARQIARLQLPVLRVALRDASFFSSRRHPVRRFINRVSSLGSALDDFASGPGKELLVRVSKLVEEIVDGDFDQIELYGEKLLELEVFTAEQARAEVKASAAANTLRVKELEWRVQHRFSLQLQAALEPLSLAGYLKEFLSQVWGQVILTATERDGADSAYARKVRRAGFDLVISIQPKRSLEQRNHFLATLPALMATLKEGMALIDWPAPARAAFFGKLIADHAGSLKTTPATDLDYNMMVRHLETAFRTPIPNRTEVAADPVADVAKVVFEQRFSPEEAKSLGLLSDGAVDWSGKVDVPADGQAPSATRGQPVDQSLGPVVGDEPTEGPLLRHALQLGFSYQLQLKDQWEKVRLAYMSPGRNLFLFTHGSKDRRAISMTARMLERLCEARRMRSFESALLLDRATERARQQLAGGQAPSWSPSR